MIPMKKPLLMGIFCIVILAMLALTGCVETTSNRIEGTAYNRTGYDVRLKAHCTSGIYQDIYRDIFRNSTDKFWVTAGFWEITVWYDDGRLESNSQIGKDTLEVRKTDDTFDICIYEDYIWMNAYEI